MLILKKKKKILLIETEKKNYLNVLEEVFLNHIYDRINTE